MLLLLSLLLLLLLRLFLFLLLFLLGLLLSLDYYYYFIFFKWTVKMLKSANPSRLHGNQPEATPTRSRAPGSQATATTSSICRGRSRVTGESVTTRWCTGSPGPGYGHTPASPSSQSLCGQGATGGRSTSLQSPKYECRARTQARAIRNSN